MIATTSAVHVRSPSQRPHVLLLSGLDPTGGAGIQADIEAVRAAGGHPLPVITTLTVQNTSNVQAVHPVDPDLLGNQLRCLLADCRIDAVKIGLLGNAAQIQAITEILAPLSTVPIICDPVLRAGGGRDLADATLETALRQHLLPLVRVLTPNAAEARRLSGCATLDAAADQLLRDGCQHVLITGGDEPSAAVQNTWHHHADHSSTQAATRIQYTWPRLPGIFHGAGCTLAAALATQLAAGSPINDAMLIAQRWTHATLESAYAVGLGRRIPNRTMSA